MGQTTLVFDDYIEYLEQLGDELAGGGDYINADCISNVIKFLDEQKQIHIAKHTVSDGDCNRCPNCGSFVYGKFGRCIDCGQRYKP